MPCYHPLKRFVIRDVSGDIVDGKVTSYGADGIVQRGSTWVPFVGDQHFYGCRVSREFQIIGCGQCIGCRCKRASDWATRMMLESQYHDESWFITLTYDDKHLHLVDGCHPETGEAGTFASLCKRDMQLWLKRLRETSGDKIRYYLCGEYGGRTLRPHYHAVIFGLHLDSEHLKVYKMSGSNPLYNHPLLDKTWSDKHGLIGWCVAGSLSFDSAGYTARYTTKKLMSGYKHVYDAMSIEPEFSLMSRKPGLARQWYEDHKYDVYDTDEIFLSGQREGRAVRPPSYYDKLFDVENPDEMAAIKERRVAYAQASMEHSLLHTDKSYLEMLSDKEKNFKAKSKKLYREKV